MDSLDDSPATGGTASLVECCTTLKGISIVDSETKFKSSKQDLIALEKAIDDACNDIKAKVCSKLQVIVEQISCLKNQAQDVLLEADKNMKLHKVACNFVKHPGQVYHLYQRESGEFYFSILSKDEWGDFAPRQTYKGSYRLEQDQSWTPSEYCTKHEDRAFIAELLFNNPVAVSALNIGTVSLVKRNITPEGVSLFNSKAVTKPSETDLVALVKAVDDAYNDIIANACTKLQVIMEQLLCLKNQAQDVLLEADKNMKLHQIACNFVKHPGQVYHLYERESGQLYFSILSKDEWGDLVPHQIYKGSYRLEEDQTWLPVYEGALIPEILPESLEGQNLSLQCSLVDQKVIQKERTEFSWQHFCSLTQQVLFLILLVLMVRYQQYI